MEKKNDRRSLRLAMRRKMRVEKIQDDEQRERVLIRRKKQLVKKAMELAVLCDVDVALVIIGGQHPTTEGLSTDPSALPPRITEYASMDIDLVLSKYAKHCNEPHEVFSTADVMTWYNNPNNQGLPHHYGHQAPPPQQDPVMGLYGTGADHSSDEDDEATLTLPIIPGPTPHQREVARPYTEDYCKRAEEMFRSHSYPSGADHADKFVAVTAAAEQLYARLLDEFDAAQKKIDSEPTLKALITGQALVGGAGATAAGNAAYQALVAASLARQAAQQTAQAPAQVPGEAEGTPGSGGAAAVGRAKVAGLNLSVTIPDNKRGPILPLQQSATGAAASSVPLFRAGGALPSARGGMPSVTGASPQAPNTLEGLLPHLGGPMDTPGAMENLMRNGGLMSLQGISDVPFEWPSPRVAAQQAAGGGTSGGSDLMHVTPLSGGKATPAGRTGAPIDRQGTDALIGDDRMAME